MRGVLADQQNVFWTKLLYSRPISERPYAHDGTGSLIHNDLGNRSQGQFSPASSSVRTNNDQIKIEVPNSLPKNYGHVSALDDDFDFDIFCLATVAKIRR